MRTPLLALLLLATTPVHANLFTDLKTAVTGHIADYQARSGPDQVLEGATPIKTSAFRTDDRGQDRLHSGEGGVSLVEKDGVHYIQLHADLKIGLAPDLFLFVSPESGIDHEDRFNSTEQVELGPLVKGEGASFYALENLTAEQVDSLGSVTVWCKQFGEFMASADL